MTYELPAAWRARWLFERGLAAMYLVAFVVALNQFLPLAGEHGLLPAAPFLQQVPFLETPSLFHWVASDRAFQWCAWIGIALSAAALSGAVSRAGALASAALWASLYVLYLSFINAGQTWYSFGWESLLVEVGFFTIFTGARATPPATLLNWIYRWTLFRMMFGAGLIKIRGDACWRDLSCLDYFFETQPMPNPLSWYFHHLPKSLLHGGVAFNHFVELVVPFAFFLPQPFASIAGVLTIAFQAILILGGNLSWLNWLTLVLAITTIDDRFLAWLPIRKPELRRMPSGQTIATAVLATVVVLLSVPPTLNMLSPDQVMNTSFNPFQIVNTYGAFGSVTKDRYEIVIEGTDAETLTPATLWKEYEFKGKPGAVTYRPPLVAPYHMRLDWLMWFAAMSNASDYSWFEPLLLKLLEGDRAVLGLLRTNPFPERPPRWIRAQLYLYRFTSPEERRRTGAWWTRTLAGPYFPEARLKQ
jgi:hypothetical protein